MEISAVRKTALAGAAAAALVAGIAVATPVANAGSSDVNQDLAAARAATAKYHDVQAAIDDGYQVDPECFEVEGLGAMGHHYFNPGKIVPAEELDPASPQLVLYQPRKDGSLKLVAVEYFVVAADQVGEEQPDGSVVYDDSDRPHLFGEAFQGPMPGHFEGMPVHYDLHAWVWQHNPDGMFAQFNPAGSC